MLNLSSDCIGNLRVIEYVKKFFTSFVTRQPNFAAPAWHNVYGFTVWLISG